ncbi:MAG: zf-HC2 domain-containing protein [Nitrospira sp.]|nr:zf-HC2 domain-containing protein [Nitrospira sp.]
MSWVARFLPTCQEMSHLLSDALDRRLPWHIRARMFAHLRMCVLCEQYRHQLALLRRLLRLKDDSHGTGGQAPQPGLPDEAKERIRRALHSSHS